MSGDSSHELEAGDDLVPGDDSHTDQGAVDADVRNARPTSPALKLTLTVAASAGMVIPGVDGDKDLGGWGFDDKVEGLMLEKHSTSSTSSTTHREPPRSGILHAPAAEKKHATASTLPKAPLERADNSLPPSGAVTPLSLSQEIAFDMIQLIPPLSGLVWREVDPGIDLQVHDGRELSNSELSGALATKTVFTSQEWDAFGIRDLRMHDLVRSGDSYFTPAPSEGVAAAERGDCSFQRSKGQAQMPDESTILAEIADSTSQLNPARELDVSSSAAQQVRVRVLSASTVKVVWSPAPKPDLAPWLRRPQSSASQCRIRPSSSQGFVGSISPAAKLSSSAPRGVSKPNVRASSPTAVKELFTSPLADRATGKTLPRPFSHIGNHRDMGTSLRPPPNLRASSPTAMKELFTFPLADRATGEALPRPFSHIGNHRDMGTSLQPTWGEYSVATKRRAQTTTPGRKSVDAGGTWPTDDDASGMSSISPLTSALRVASPGPKEVSKRRLDVPQAVSASEFHVSASRFQASVGNQTVENQGSSESYNGKITLHLPRSGSAEAESRKSPQAVSASEFHVNASKFQASAEKQTVEHQGSSKSYNGKITLHLPRSGSDGAESRQSLQPPQPSPLREYSSEAGEVIREHSFERSSESNGGNCPPHASGAHHSKRAIEAVHHQRALHGLPHSWNASTAIELQLARSFQRRTELNHVAALDNAPPGVHACKSVQLAARKCAGLRRGAARLVTKETDTSGGVYGFLRRHSADITQLLDADITVLLPQYLQEARISTSNCKQAGTTLRTVGAERRFDERKSESHLHATGMEKDRSSDASSPMPRSMGSHTPLGSATPSKSASRIPPAPMRGVHGSFAQIDASGGGIGNVFGAVGYMTSGHASPFNLGRSDVEAEADIPPAYETFQPGCYDQHLQVRQGSDLLPRAGRGNNVTGGEKGAGGEVLKEWSWEEDTLNADTSCESQLGAEGSEHFDEPAQRGIQFIGEVKALLEHGRAFQSPAQKKRSLSSNLARRLSQQRRLQNAVHTQPIVNPSPSHHRGPKSR